MVAMTVAAIAATVILSYVRSLMARAEREQSHQLAVMGLMNDSLRLVHGGAQVAEEPRLEGNRLVIAPLNPTRDSLPPVVVRNFSPLGDPLPAVGLAYTPFQVYAVERGRYALHRIGPALPPPAGAAPFQTETLTPEMLQDPVKPAVKPAAGKAPATPGKP
jgi:type II secretory pathway pseudopilin PulG